MNYQDLVEACRRLDVAACRAFLDFGSPGESERSIKFAEAVRHSGCLSNPHGRSSDESFRDLCNQVLSQPLDKESAKYLIEYIKSSIPIKRLYRAVQNRMNACSIMTAPPEVILWATVRSASAHIQDFMLEVIAKSRDEKGEDQKRGINNFGKVDAVTEELTKSLGIVIRWLSFVNKWKNSDELCLPQVCETTAQQIAQATELLELASLWRTLEEADEWIRFFGGDVTQRDFQTEGESGELIVVATDCLLHDLEVERIERIAHHRLMEWQHKNRLEIDVATNMRSWVQDPRLGASLQ